MGHGSICEDTTSFQKRARREDRRVRTSYELYADWPFDSRAGSVQRTTKLLVIGDLLPTALRFESRLWGVFRRVRA